MPTAREFSPENKNKAKLISFFFPFFFFLLFFSLSMRSCYESLALEVGISFFPLEVIFPGEVIINVYPDLCLN